MRHSIDMINRLSVIVALTLNIWASHSVQVVLFAMWSILMALWLLFFHYYLSGKLVKLTFPLDSILSTAAYFPTYILSFVLLLISTPYIKRFSCKALCWASKCLTSAFLIYLIHLSTFHFCLFVESFRRVICFGLSTMSDSCYWVIVN